MKKIITLFVGVFMVLGFVSGCGSTGSEGSGDTATKGKDIEYGEATFLNDVKLVRDDVKLSLPWKIGDLKEVGIEDFDYFKYKVDKDVTYAPGRGENNYKVLMDGKYRPEGTNITSVILHAKNLTDKDCAFNELTLWQITLYEGSEKVSLNGDIFVGAKRSKIIEKYGNPGDSTDKENRNISYKLDNADGKLYSDQSKKVDLKLELFINADDVVTQIRFAIDD